MPFERKKKKIHMISSVVNMAAEAHSEIKKSCTREHFKLSPKASVLLCYTNYILGVEDYEKLIGWAARWSW